MKRITLLVLAILLGLGFSIGQSKKANQTDVSALPKTNQEAKNKPQTNVKVNKEYDKNGNLISYDSTYSWSYSSSGDNPMVSDSMLNELKRFFDQGAPLSIDGFFDNRLPQDSIIKNDAPLGDFFTSRFRENMEQMNKMFSNMDSIRSKDLQEESKPESKKVVPKLNNKITPKTKSK